MGNHCSIRQNPPIFFVHLDGQTFRMKLLVKLGQGFVGRQSKKFFCGIPSAFPARSMTGGECSCFIEKKQLCVSAGGHDRPPSIPEVQFTDNPALSPILPAHASRFIVQAPTVSHPRASLRHSAQAAKRVNAILSGHSRHQFTLCSAPPPDATAASPRTLPEPFDPRRWPGGRHTRALRCESSSEIGRLRPEFQETRPPHRRL